MPQIDRQQQLAGVEPEHASRQQDALGRAWSAINPQPQPWQLVTLPPRRAGTVMIFRPFERVSYALVVEAIAPMHIADEVDAP